MTRDARGRFCTVPDLILDAACWEAVRVLRDMRCASPADDVRRADLHHWCTAQDKAAEVLAHATHTAALVGRAS